MANKKPFLSFEGNFNQNYFAISKFLHVFIGMRNNTPTGLVSMPTIKLILRNLIVNS